MTHEILCDTKKNFLPFCFFFCVSFRFTCHGIVHNTQFPIRVASTLCMELYIICSWRREAKTDSIRHKTFLFGDVDEFCDTFACDFQSVDSHFIIVFRRAKRRSRQFETLDIYFCFIGWTMATSQCCRCVAATRLAYGVFFSSSLLRPLSIIFQSIKKRKKITLTCLSRYFSF